ncbi:MAG: TraE/TraK family type IV conjugative transfer system protein, partial [Pseudomonadota bacterium]
MTPDAALTELKTVGRQRNVAFLLLLIALVAIVVLSLSVTAKKDQLVLVPLTSHPTTVEAGKVRRDYLRETAITISYFFENITPETAEYFEEPLRRNAPLRRGLERVTRARIDRVARAGVDGVPGARIERVARAR